MAERKKILESELKEGFRKLLENYDKTKEYYAYVDGVLITPYKFCGKNEEEALRVFYGVNPECRGRNVKLREKIRN